MGEFWFSINFFLLKENAWNNAILLNLSLLTDSLTDVVPRNFPRKSKPYRKETFTDLFMRISIIDVVRKGYFAHTLSSSSWILGSLKNAF